MSAIVRTSYWESLDGKIDIIRVTGLAFHITIALGTLLPKICSEVHTDCLAMGTHDPITRIPLADGLTCTSASRNTDHN